MCVSGEGTKEGGEPILAQRENQTERPTAELLQLLTYGQAGTQTLKRQTRTTSLSLTSTPAAGHRVLSSPGPTRPSLTCLSILNELPQHITGPSPKTLPSKPQ
eukprot:GHVU01179185.1.p2 GENE.GHVU01179185.1~~GHVU01179185.1.p2  ORF type:complete len:103 (+),score=3.02 GHVU01179185.1:168-476(+)